eukprot:TRINITY_DN1522_c10_g1_i1.p1 TRINITY_DN1522_c10_g1~~TRINITY_DN1522_c10_g1_i1.p1  ORF type:complete len:198 (+),score=21.79 TRINITY_DN1522_c10_g1_i1:55-648(+)
MDTMYSESDSNYLDEPPALLEGSLSGSSAPPSPPMLCVDETFVLTVEFKYGSRADYVSLVEYDIGEYVIVEGDRGIDLGLVVEVPSDTGNPTGATVSRLATYDEVLKWKACHGPEQEALQFIRVLVSRHNIPIEVHGAEYQFDRKKLTFHYSTEADHPEFKAILRGCYRAFKCRIWMNNCRPKENDPGIFQPLFVNA